MAEHADPAWEERAARYDEGLIGSRGLMEWEMSLIRSDRRRPPGDGGPPSRTTRASSRSSGAPRRRASPSRSSATGSASSSRRRSSGWASRSCRSSAPGRRSPGPCVDRVPERPPDLLRVRDVQAPAGARPAGGGPCRRVHRRRRERSVCGRLRATSSSPSGSLVPICLANGWPFRALDRVRRDPRLVERAARRLAARSRIGALPRPSAKPFFCGPEVWGEGRDGSARRLTRRYAIDHDRSGRPPQRRPLAMNAIRRSDGTLRVEGAST